jgi:alpha-ketoglutarate-dependent 2,4-dichlorophenoxyacetate dioxygenase
MHHPVSFWSESLNSRLILQYGICVFPKTGLDDKRHVEFAAQFGELDDIKPYLAAGRKNRLSYDELFDVSNVDLDGTLLDPNSPRGHANRVRIRLPQTPCFFSAF